MRVAFDHQAFCLQRTGGISRYFCELASALISANEDVKIFAPLYRNTYLRALPAARVQGYWVKDYPPYSAALCTRLIGRLASAALERWQPEVVHETYYSHRPSSSKKAPVVLSVFDMISELGLMGEAGQPIELRNTPKYQAVQRADHVICISQSTQRDLIRLFDVPASKTSVIYLGCDTFRTKSSKVGTWSDPTIGPRVEPTSSLTTGPMIEGCADVADATAKSNVGIATVQHSTPYLLYVGLRGTYKNFSRLLEAYAKSQRLSGDFALVAFGGGAFTDAEKSTMSKLGLSLTQVRQQAGTDDDLAKLYRQAVAFIYPSLYEGFGLPPLEAMAQGCPVVSSQTSSMPEVLGDAAEYFDPEHVDDMGAAIERVAYSTERSEALTRKGHVRATMFDWSTCAAQTTQLYQTLSVGSR